MKKYLLLTLLALLMPMVATAYDALIDGIGESGHATYCSEKALDFSAVTDVKAYVATGFDPSLNELLLTPVKQVPAGEGIFVIGKPGIYEIPECETAMVYSNLLCGMTWPEEIEAISENCTNFTLMDGDEGTSFYPMTEKTPVFASSAYLRLPIASVPANVKAIKVTLVDGVVGVDEIKDEKTASTLYDINGHRLSSQRKGLNIIRYSDGTSKKVMVK